MDDLVAFLRARLDAEAGVARAALELAPPNLLARTKWNTLPRGRRATELGIAPEAQLHASMHGPVRVLADIEAKRALLTAVVSAKRDRDHWHACPPNDPEERAKVIAGIGARWSAWQFVLGQLAKPYGDHPGFREEWRHLV